MIDTTSPIIPRQRGQWNWQSFKNLGSPPPDPLRPLFHARSYAPLSRVPPLPLAGTRVSGCREGSAAAWGVGAASGSRHPPAEFKGPGSSALS